MLSSMWQGVGQRRKTNAKHGIPHFVIIVGTKDLCNSHVMEEQAQVPAFVLLQVQQLTFLWPQEANCNAVCHGKGA